MAEQPRVPAGSPRGGRWTRYGTGSYPPVLDADAIAAATKSVDHVIKLGLGNVVAAPRITDEDNKAWREEWDEKTGFKGAATHERNPDGSYVRPELSKESHKQPLGWPKPGGRHMWGSTHSNSTDITGESADIMGIEGYRKVDQVNPQWENPYPSQAKFMLKHIAASPGAEETLYHGWADKEEINWKKGDTIRLPLTATAGSPDVISYGERIEQKDQRGAPTLFIFEKGTKMLAYSKNSRKDEDGNDNAKEFGYHYTEAIVAGGFEVVDVTTAANTSNRAWAPGGSPEVTIVKLRPTEYFNPVTKKWEEQ